MNDIDSHGKGVMDFQRNLAQLYRLWFMRHTCILMRKSQGFVKLMAKFLDSKLLLSAMPTATSQMMVFLVFPIKNYHRPPTNLAGWLPSSSAAWWITLTPTPWQNLQDGKGRIMILDVHLSGISTITSRRGVSELFAIESFLVCMSCFAWVLVDSAGLIAPWLQRMNWLMPSRSLTRTAPCCLILTQKKRVSPIKRAAARLWSRTRVAPSMPLNSKMFSASLASMWIRSSSSVQICAHGRAVLPTELLFGKGIERRLDTCSFLLPLSMRTETETSGLFIVFLSQYQAESRLTNVCPGGATSTIGPLQVVPLTDWNSPFIPKESFSLNVVGFQGGRDDPSSWRWW